MEWMPVFCKMVQFHEERHHNVCWETQTFGGGGGGGGSQNLNHSNKQTEEREHITNKNGACWISCKTCQIVFKTKIFVRTQTKLINLNVMQFLSDAEI